MPSSYQIRLPDAEKRRLISRIEDDFGQAKTSSRNWENRCAGWMQKWENRVNPAGIGNENKPNHTVPVTQWQTLTKLSRSLQSLLGDDAEITAKGVGPSDSRHVHKAGRWMTSRVFDQMELVNPLCIFEFRRILNGHSVAHMPWYRRTFDAKIAGKVKRVCDYEGPGFFPQEPGEVVNAPERGVTSIHDFSFVGRRVRVTVDELQRGDGTLYQGTSNRDFLERAIKWAKDGSSDWDLLENPVITERERSEGMDYDSVFDSSRGLWMWEWYGYWRPLQKRKRDAAVDDLEKRLPFEADWVIRFLPGMREIVGCQDLLDIYPRMRQKRPFFESTLLKDGTYRPKGFGALLEDLEDEATANSRLFTAAGELSVWPIIFYRPGGGMQPKAFKVEPGKAYPTEDPTSVNVINLRPNLDFGSAKQQDLLSHSERLTGQGDPAMGISNARPNAPRTAAGQIALIEEGNVRAWLDATVLKEDMQHFLRRVWELDSSMLPTRDPGLFFRVTEEQAKGLFDTTQGGAYMTAQEFGGKFDFRLKFATSIWARQARKQELMTFYQICSASPIVMTNPRALWSLLNRLAKEFGIDDFGSIVPPPPELDAPKTPDQEWNLMLEGEYPACNPQDHDEMHILEHSKQIDLERKNPARDEQAIGFGIRHLLEHKQQQRMKLMMQAQVTSLVQSLREPDGGGPVGQEIEAALSRQEQAGDTGSADVLSGAGPAGGQQPAPFSQ